jgi:acyl-CoA synthetase (AMP-forming)/AMP-acid ligase II
MTAINPRLGPSERQHILRSANPVVVLDDLPASLGELAAVGDPERRRVTLAPGDPACIVWTGGTTGTPKGVVFDHRCQHAMAEAAGPLSAMGDRRLSPLPFAHVGTMTRLWDEWSHLITTVVTPTPWTPAATAALLVTEAVTVCQGVPTQYALLLDHLEERNVTAGDLRALRIAGIGGARIPPELVGRIEEQLGAPVVARYASTETCVATGTAPGDPPSVVATTVGRPTPPVELRVVGADGAALGPGEDNVGTVCIRSRAVMRHYLPVVPGDPTSAPPSPVDGDGWCHTGDLGWVGSDGNLRLVGRSTEMYVRGGYNVYPAEVENCLGDLPGLGAVAVVGVEAAGSRLGEVGVAFVVPAHEGANGDAPGGGTGCDGDAVRAHVAARLASYKIPDMVVEVADLPLTALGKVDKVALAARAGQEWRNAQQGDSSGPGRKP